MGNHAKYIAIVAGTAAILIGLVLSVNLLVDPLWFFNGNQITEHNARYNERYAKANRFLKDPSQYDCVILGSSTSLLLDADKIANRRCFNFAFSRGHVSEYVDFLRFITSKTDTIDLVVVSFDAYNLLEAPFGDTKPSAPPFIRASATPPGPLESYLGLGPFLASVKALLGIADNGGHYDGQFRAVLAETSTPYRPDDEAFDRNFRQRFDHTIGRFDPATLRHVEALRKAANGATLIGYVPPIVAHFIAYLRVEGQLDAYLRSIYAASRRFDAFHDFTVPSTITQNEANTIDGMHFSRAVNDRIAGTLSGTTRGFGVTPQSLTYRAYRRRFIEATDTFLAQARFLKASGDICPDPAQRGVRYYSC